MQGKEVIFLETAMNLQSARSHTVVHAVPVLLDLFAKAPMHFKAEVDSASGEWSQHHAKRMIDTRDKVRLACKPGGCKDQPRSTPPPVQPRLQSASWMQASLDLRLRLCDFVHAG